jgi:hypothetical protein
LIKLKVSCRFARRGLSRLHRLRVVRQPKGMGSKEKKLAAVSRFQSGVMGWLLCRQAIVGMQPAHRNITAYRRVALALLTLLLATGLTAATVYYPRSADPFCYGRLSAGFPMAIICDASGESPHISVGNARSVDLNNLNLVGALADILFYSGLFWLIGVVSQRAHDLGWS